MTTFVLVHGSWHGAWCWKKVLPLLEAADHRAIAIDLPGHGADPMDPKTVTLEDYASRIASVIEKQSDPVVLVGHSMGGAAITRAAELCPDRIRLLVFLAAFAPYDGCSIADQALEDQESLLQGNLLLDPAAGQAVLKESVVAECFYNDCSSEDIEFAQEKLCADPLQPLISPVLQSDSRARKVPRVYVECLQDRAITPGQQRRVQKAFDWAEIYRLETGHSPFFSRPNELCACLLQSLNCARRNEYEADPALGMT